MSGTSLDGVDVALLRTDGDTIFELGPFLTLPYDDNARAILQDAVAVALAAAARNPAAGISRVAEYSGDKSSNRRRRAESEIGRAEEILTEFHHAAVKELIHKNSINTDNIDIIGFHGQTIIHQPEFGVTWQIGDGRALAQATGLPVVSDFRSADVAAGGQGAPLAPLYHAALYCGDTEPDVEPDSVAILNIGGVANVTWLGGGEENILAFDTGPGNGLIDQWVSLHCGGGHMDVDGQLALGGKINRAVLADLLAHKFFAVPPPKSLDRYDFALPEAEFSGANGKPVMSPADGAATLAAFTAHSIAKAGDHFPQSARRWLVCGGGRHNPALMQMLRECLGVPVEPVEAVGWQGDALEAQAFAYLAVRSLYDLPLSLPSTTGVSVPTAGGRIDYPD